MNGGEEGMREELLMAYFMRSRDWGKTRKPSVRIAHSGEIPTGYLMNSAVQVMFVPSRSTDFEGSGSELLSGQIS
jgi:hypothetical protein